MRRTARRHCLPGGRSCRGRIHFGARDHPESGPARTAIVFRRRWRGFAATSFKRLEFRSGSSPAGTERRTSGGRATARKSKRRKPPCLAILNPDCAGIEIGKDMRHVAVDPERFEEPVRAFDGFARDHEAMAAPAVVLRGGGGGDGVDLGACPRDLRVPYSVGICRLQTNSAIYAVISEQFF